MMLKKLTALLCALAMVLSCAAFAEGGFTMDAKVLYDHVLEVETYTELDYDYIDALAIETLDLWGGGCTAVAKVNDAGETLVGRNMDLNISNKPAFVVRTKTEGDYETVGLAYLFNDFMQDFDDILSGGLSEAQAKILPFICTDIMNTEGLYIETNMRNGESWPTGYGKFICDGTNPGGRRVFVAAVPRFVAQRCSTVQEALDYIAALDIYTQTEPTAWNFCFMLADATGRYGLLEVACDRVIWHEGQNAQANFYVDEELYAMEELQAGLGRYEVVTSGIDAVQTEEEMFALIDKASYFQMYTDHCAFDYRSEFVGQKPSWTLSFVMDDANAEAVEAERTRIMGDLAAMSRQDMQDANCYWESVFTIVANCSARTLNVRFFEDAERTVTLGFDK